MKLRALFGLAPLAALVATAWVAPASAQDLTPERVRLELDATDQRIEQATTIVATSDDPQAHAELTFAVDLQERARGAFASAQLALAVRLTRDARGHADRAIAIVRGLPDPDRVRAQIERTRELLERARERIEECQDDRAQALIRVAFDMQARAEEAGLSGRFLAALQLTMSARERVHRALRMCRMQENLQESAERALQRTDQVISRARDAVSERGSEPARQALGRALDLQEQAQRSFREERFEASLRLTTSARAFAFRALRLTGRSI